MGNHLRNLISKDSKMVKFIWSFAIGALCSSQDCTSTKSGRKCQYWNNNNRTSINMGNMAGQTIYVQKSTTVNHGAIQWIQKNDGKSVVAELLMDDKFTIMQDKCTNAR